MGSLKQWSCLAESQKDLKFSYALLFLNQRLQPHSKSICHYHRRSSEGARATFDMSIGFPIDLPLASSGQFLEIKSIVGSCR